MTGKEDPECRPTQHCSGFRLRKKWPQGDMAGHNAVGTPSGARRCSADGKIALGLQSQTSVRQAASAFTDQAFALAAWTPGVFFLKRWDRDHFAVTRLTTQPS